MEWSTNHSTVAFLFVIYGLFMTARIIFAPPHEKQKGNDDDFRNPPAA